MSVKIKFGSKDIPFVYKGDKLVYPNPIKDGLLLWYDFKGMRNTDVGREVAKDLSGNGNHGTLQNFNYSTSDFNLPDLYKNTRLIVKDPSDPIYSDYPNPPVGAVFNNYNPVSNKIVRGNIDMPALVNTLIANMKLYHLHSDSIFLENAKIIGDYISSLMRSFSFYGADTWVVPNRVSLIDGEWTPLYGEINTRSLLQATYALSEVLKVTGLYGSEVYQLTQTIGLMHNNIKSRVTEGELRAAMNGAVYEYIYTNEDTGTLVFSWGEFGISSSDMIAKAINSYIESMGADALYDSQGTEFIPQQILDGAAQHIKAVYDSGALTMEPTGLPYSFLQADSESETGVNWDWVDTQERGDTWFTNDTTLWIIEGISRLSQLTEIEGLYNIAKTYRDNFLALRELNHDSYDDKGDTRVIFYDRYNFDGSHLTDDVSISISGTALLWEVDEILGIKDGVLHSQMRDTLEAHIITNKNSDINGAFGWDANDATSFIEMKATGEIYSSPFIQADLSVSSGYKDNTLVFDGVDDKLAIPELELDKTAMTVMYDGKLYVYEDDKVIKVKKNSEDNSAELEGLEVGGRNLIVNSDDLKPSSISANVVVSKVSDGSFNNVFKAETEVSGASNYFTTIYQQVPEEPKVGQQATLSLLVRGVVFEGFSNTMNIYYNSGTKNQDMVGITEEYQWLSVTFDVNSEVPRFHFYPKNFSELYFARAKLEIGNIATDWTPAPEDFQTTSLSPPSLSNLQLYNRPLRKDELLHNAESKGLKKLKPGVVVQDGLVLHYDFSHESNTSEYKDKAFDYSGNGNHGVLTNFAYSDYSGYQNGGLEFDGVDDEVVIPYKNNIFSVDFTWSAVIKPYIVDKDMMFMYGSTTAQYFRIQNGKLGASVRGQDSPVAYALTNFALDANTAYHVVLSHTNGDFKIYANGEQVGESDKGMKNERYRLSWIGKYTSSDPRAFEGAILSAQVHNKALSAEEIAHNYAVEKEKFNII